jgi:hypothetical protein
MPHPTRLAVLLALLAAIPPGQPQPVRAQQAGYGQTFGTTPMERQVYDGGAGRPSGGSILDSPNPIELMNRLRRGAAMEDATPPASAIDQALRELEVQSNPVPPSPPSSEPAAAPQPVGQPRVSLPQPLSPTASSLALPRQAGPAPGREP